MIIPICLLKRYNLDCTKLTRPYKNMTVPKHPDIDGHRVFSTGSRKEQFSIYRLHDRQRHNVSINFLQCMEIWTFFNKCRLKSTREGQWSKNEIHPQQLQDHTKHVHVAFQEYRKGCILLLQLVEYQIFTVHIEVSVLSLS